MSSSSKSQRLASKYIEIYDFKTFSDLESTFKKYSDEKEISNSDRIQDYLNDQDSGINFIKTKKTLKEASVTDFNKIKFEDFLRFKAVLEGKGKQLKKIDKADPKKFAEKIEKEKPKITEGSAKDVKSRIAFFEQERTADTEKEEKIKKHIELKSAEEDRKRKAREQMQQEEKEMKKKKKEEEKKRKENIEKANRSGY